MVRLWSSRIDTPVQLTTTQCQARQTAIVQYTFSLDVQNLENHQLFHFLFQARPRCVRTRCLCNLNRSLYRCRLLQHCPLLRIFHMNHPCTR